jgi:hypothetical protein
MSKFLPVVAVEAARIVHNHFIQSGRRSCKALDLPALFAAGRATPSFFIHDLAPFLVVEVMNVPVPRRLNDPEKKLGILIGHVVALLREGGDGVEFGLNSLAKSPSFFLSECSGFCVDSDQEVVGCGPFGHLAPLPAGLVQPAEQCCRVLVGEVFAVVNL